MTPEQVLDLQVDTAEWWRTATGQNYGNIFANSMKETANSYDEIPRLADRERDTLLTAETYVITHDMSLTLEAMAQALPPEDDAVILNVQAPMHANGFAYFERPLYIQDIRDQTLNVSAVAWRTDIVHMNMGGTPEEPQATLEIPALILSLYGRTDDPKDTSLASITDRAEARRAMGVLSLVHIQPILHGYQIPADGLIPVSCGCCGT